MSAGRDELTPLGKLWRNLAACPPECTPVALLTTGSFNPLHVEHLDIHRRAKAALVCRAAVFKRNIRQASK